MKLNVLLGTTDALKTKYKNMVNDMTRFFDKTQGAFRGEKATYVMREGMVDKPEKRSYTKVVTTVDEKLAYFLEESPEFINALFSQEKTNAIGVATAELMVNGVSWGVLTSLELLRLKSLLESGDLGSLETFLSKIPTRSDSEIWSPSTVEEYTNRNIYSLELNHGESKSTEKEEYILADPNLANITSDRPYTPKTSVRTKVITVGDYTQQSFSGAWSHRERAGALKRRNDLLIAVVRALKECNNCEAVESTLTADKIFGFIFKG